MKLIAGAAALVASACVAGCHGEPLGPADDAPTLLVSEATSASAAALVTRGGANLSAGAMDQSTAWIALPPGSVAAGIAAVVRNEASGAFAQAELVSGGFDPVGVPAKTGDTVSVNVTDSSGRRILLMRAMVPVRRPPIVIRTQPSRHRTDVPLNARIIAVFSEPMDGASLSGGALAIYRGDTLVPGRVSLWSGGLIAEFLPDAKLEPGAAYRLVVSQVASNQSGELMTESYDIEFTTGSSAAEPAGLLVHPASAIRQPGAYVYLTAALVDAAGNLIAGPAPTWETSDAAIGALDETGARNDNLVRTGLPGTALVTVSSAGQTGHATVSVQPLRFEALTVGFGSTCGTTDLRIYCWGTTYGILGAGVAGTHTPGPLPTMIGATQVVTGKADAASCENGLQLNTSCLYSCALVSGTAFCWNGSSSVSEPIATSERIVALSTGQHHACGITATGAARCWGALTGPTAATLSPARGPAAEVAGIGGLEGLSAGANHDCATGRGGGLWCWGDNSAGQLGRGDRYPASSALVPYKVQLTNVTAVSAGLHHTCALDQAGIAYCWGSNDAGELGTGARDDALQPTRVSGDHRWQSITAGTHFTCAVDLSGTAFCWGDNRSRQLGSALDGPIREPRAVETRLRFRALYAGDTSTCGVTVESIAYCWGNASLLGDGTEFSDVSEVVAPVVTPTEVLLQR